MQLSTQQDGAVGVERLRGVPGGGQTDQRLGRPQAASLDEYKVIRRNGAVVGFEPSKIVVAMSKAFIAVRGGQGAASAAIREQVEALTSSVVGALLRHQPAGGSFHIEDIQDQVELSLMRAGAHDVARAYVLYRERRAQQRARRRDQRLARFDLDRLARALQPQRDLQFTYLGLQTLYDRYFLHHDGRRFELPQTFFMRVAMGLSLNEMDPEARAIEFYEVLSRFDFMCSTPTLFNSGTCHPQLSSCYLTTVADDLDSIYEAIKENAMLAKYAGGLGNDWTPVRALGSHIRGTNGKSQGVVPFLKVVNDTAVAVNQGGKRKGAGCCYLGAWHLDIEEFLELRKNTGDDRRRTHDMNTANWIPDLFMKSLMGNSQREP